MEAKDSNKEDSEEEYPKKNMKRSKKKLKR
jgi:hypothetical protein